MTDTETVTDSDAAGARRPIAARNTAWAARIAAWLARSGVTPNAISVGSVGAAALAAGALVGERVADHVGVRCGLYIVAILGIQSRLLCNLFDGMVAVEGGKKSKSGEVFNDFPDRIADPLILAAAGYAVGGEWGVGLGWAAALLAVMTAYVRVLGRSLGTGIYFLGPMAKQHRMATMTGACAVAAALCFWRLDRWAVLVALGVINVGCVITLVRRTRRIVLDLEGRP